MNVLFSLTNLSIGGAQMFVLNLANAFSKDPDFTVCIYDHNPEYSSDSLYSFCDDKIEIINYSKNKLLRFLILKFNGLIKRLGFKFDFRKWYSNRVFLKTIKKRNIHLVNSQMSESDFLCGELLESSVILVLTLHGEFELYLNKKRDETVLKINLLLDKRPRIIYTADKNYHAISEHIVKRCLGVNKIYIGMDPHNFKIQNLSKEEIFSNDEVFVLGMVSRGIPEKGWEFLINVFKILSTGNDNFRLLLVGEGEYIQSTVKNANDQKIILFQYANNFQDYFSCYQLMDLFVFPTFFEGESVPTVVAESLYWSVPVIANDHAEIKNMISVSNELAGEVIRIESAEQMMKNYVSVINKFKSDLELRNHKKKLCKLAYDKFDILNIKDQYKKVFLN
jgi:glycosyltransferase involved in cell wall biosynthesis